MAVPELSIIVPVYKVEDYLSACINSILSQTFTDFELILVDDGSPDRSGAICDDYARRDSRIRVIHQANAGVSAARNAGLDVARGAFITFVDSDDMLGTPTTLEENLHILQTDRDIDIVQFRITSSTDASFTEEQLPQEGKICGKVQLLLAIAAGSIAGYVWGKIFRCEVFRGIKFPNGITLAEDTWVLVDLVDNVETLYFSARGAYCYNQRASSAVHTFNPKKCLDLFRMSFHLFRAMTKYTDTKGKQVTSYFLLTYRRLLDARIAQKDSVDLSKELRFLVPYVPKIKWAFGGAIGQKEKLWLVCIKLLGLRSFADLYVKFVRWRLSTTHK